MDYYGSFTGRPAGAATLPSRLYYTVAVPAGATPGRVVAKAFVELLGAPERHRLATRVPVLTLRVWDRSPGVPARP